MFESVCHGMKHHFHDHRIQCGPRSCWHLHEHCPTVHPPESQPEAAPRESRSRRAAALTTQLIVGSQHTLAMNVSQLCPRQPFATFSMHLRSSHRGVAAHACHERVSAVPAAAVWNIFHTSAPRIRALQHRLAMSVSQLCSRLPFATFSTHLRLA